MMYSLLLALSLCAEPEPVKAPEPTMLESMCQLLKVAHSDPAAWRIVYILHQLDEAIGLASPGGEHGLEIKSADSDLIERLQKADEVFDQFKQAFKPDKKKL